jgi:hypothetical protein
MQRALKKGDEAPRETQTSVVNLEQGYLIWSGSALQGTAYEKV